MKTINIVHPNDPRGTGNPLTIIVRKLDRIEAVKRSIAIEKEKRPYTDLVTGKQTWRVPGETTDPRADAFWYDAVKNVASGWLNGPAGDNGSAAPFNDESLFLLFGEEFDVPDYVASHVKGPKTEAFPDGEPIQFGTVSFPFYVAMEWGNPERWANPTQGGSKTT